MKNNYIKMELYRISNKKIVFKLIVLEVLLMILCYWQSSEFFFRTTSIQMGTYYNIQITFRYIIAVTLVNMLVLSDLNQGLLKVAIGFGYKRFKILIFKILACFVTIMIPNIFINFLYGIIGWSINNNIQFFQTIVVDVFINSIPLFCYICVIIFVNLYTRSQGITFIFSVVSVLFVQLIPYNYSKYLFIVYNNLSLAWNYSNVESHLLISIVLSLWTLCFIVFNKIYFDNLDI